MNLIGQVRSDRNPSHPSLCRELRASFKNTEFWRQLGRRLIKVFCSGKFFFAIDPVRQFNASCEFSVRVRGRLDQARYRKDALIAVQTVGWP
jgi:hypothetical protein